MKENLPALALACSQSIANYGGVKLIGRKADRKRRLYSTWKSSNNIYSPLETHLKQSWFENWTLKTCTWLHEPILLRGVAVICELKPSELNVYVTLGVWRKLRPRKLRPRNLRPRKLRPRNLRPRNLRPRKLRPRKLRPRKLRPRKLEMYMY